MPPPAALRHPGRTALAGALREHFALAFVVLAAVFVVSLVFGLRIWRQAVDREEADA